VNSEGVVKDEKTKSVLSDIDKPRTVAPVQGALLNIDAPPVAVRTAALKLTLHEPVAKMPELTIEGKVKPPAKQTEME
jgi:iron complex outermembrane receptor protein